MKQETLEEAVERYLNNGKPQNAYSLFIEGVKWQAERMYSEEEVIQLLTKRCKHFGTSVSPFNELLLRQNLEWFNDIKKK